VNHDNSTTREGSRYAALRLSGIEETRIERTLAEMFPGRSNERCALGQRYAELQLAAGLPLALEVEDYNADRWLLSDAERARDLVIEARDVRDARARERDEAEAAYCSEATGLTRLKKIVAVLVVLGITVVAVLAVAQLVAISLDAAAVRGYGVDLAGMEAGKRYAAQMAHYIALCAAAAIFGGFGVLVLLTNGRIALGLKVLFIIGADLALATSVALLRAHLVGQINLAFWGWALFELALSVGHGLMLWGIGSWLAREAAQADAKQQKHAAFANTAGALARAEAALSVAQAERDRLVDEVGLREDASRRRETLLELARVSDTEAYVHGTAQVVRDSAGHIAEDSLVSRVELHLAALENTIRSLPSEEGRPS
jgi:hypothetical protein